MNNSVPPAPPTQQHHWWFGVCFYLLAVIAGISSAVAEPDLAAELLLSLALPLTLAGWTFADAADRRHPLPVLSYPWIVIVSYAAVTWYVVHSRGWRGAGWLVLHTVCWFTLYAGLAIALQFLTMP